MTVHRRSRKRETQLAFEALSIEGGLLSPDWLSRVAQLAADQQGAADYGVPKGLNLRDEIGRYWRIAQAHWGDLTSGRASGAERGALSERFVTALLRDCFGFTSLAKVPPAVIAERTYPIGHAALGGRVPVIVAPVGAGLDSPSSVHGDAGRRRSAFGLAQEFLNAEEKALWGLASDGDTLRILRDNASLTRPAWIQADLARIFTEERYADFAALWLLVHESRFGRPDQPVTECALEAWRAAGREEGTRAREHLRRGVEEALLALGQGFLAHRENTALRGAFQDGTLTKEGYFQQLLRLAYRLIFLLTVEERELLHPSTVPALARKLYADGYSLKRLRERSVKRSAHDRFSDLWEATKIVFRGTATGEPRLGLPALAGIFAKTQCPALDSARLSNSALLLAVFRLSWLREESGLSRVNWRDMGPEELGSVYESLLELVPQVTDGGRRFGFATGDETKGNARKTSGSYYTPDSLVQVLLDTALEPVMKARVAANPTRPAEALLELAIVDPACGSGHFLLAAARRLAAHVARLMAHGTPSAAEYRHALRQVVGHCLHGVDLNPLAVELCKVSLWMEAVEPGLPLTFLDSHIRHGNALLGATPEIMAKGLPDAAWEVIEGDDKKVATELKKRNKKALEGQADFWEKTVKDEAAAVAAAVAALETASDADPVALSRKESSWEGLLESPAYRHQRLVADAWCAAFVWPKKPGDLAVAAPTNDAWWRLRDGQGTPPVLMVKTVERLARQYRFLHWHLAFPQVFARGGFDVVLGNPPWERVKLTEHEFFASRHDEIANASNATTRKKLIADLPSANVELWKEWCAASREAEGQSHFLRQSGRFPLCGKGDVNTYALFAEHNRTLLGPCGRAGFLAPAGLVTEDTTKEFFQALVETNSLASVFHFENEERVFPGVHHAFRFMLMTIGPTERADLLFFARTTADLRDRERHFTLSALDLAALNPNTRTCPTFRSRRDADLNLTLYRRAGIFMQESDVNGNPWGVQFATMFHLTNDSALFRSRGDLEAAVWVRQSNQYVRDGFRMLPLFEAKMFFHFDHRFCTYEGQSDAQANQGKLPELARIIHECSRLVHQVGYQFAATIASALAWAP
ncbi:N-6 DNA methylase [bacterium]|nr:N-6 DNA methylase [bacterium]